MQTHLPLDPPRPNAPSDDGRHAPGQVLARGIARHLVHCGFACLDEFSPVRGLRVDLMAVGPKGELWVVECKSSRADFIGDRKWQNYLPYCDRYFWGVDTEFPTDLLPADSGLIIADSYDAEIVRMPAPLSLSGARRKTVTRDFGRAAALRLQHLRDPHR